MSDDIDQGLARAVCWALAQFGLGEAATYADRLAPMIQEEMARQGFGFVLPVRASLQEGDQK